MESIDRSAYCLPLPCRRDKVKCTALRVGPNHLPASYQHHPCDRTHQKHACPQLPARRPEFIEACASLT
jgi:hypothetical protein